MSQQEPSTRYIAPLIGRLLIATYFLVNGLYNAYSYNVLTKAMSSIAYIEGLLMVLLILQLLGAVLVILGWYTRMAGFLLLVAVMLMTWLQLHLFPVDAGTIPAAFATFVHFIGNIGLAGAAFYLMAFGAGGISLDHFRRK